MIKRLAIAIPTYRRSDILENNLERILDRAHELGVAIYISDDSPDDATEQVVRRLSERFPDLYYRRNNPALGHDANLIATLVWPDADYVWLLGDALWVRPEPLARLLDFLDNQDLVCVNSHSPDYRQIRCLEGEAGRVLLLKALWHQTLTGATIYHRRVRDWITDQGNQLIIKRNFPQLSVVLGYASDCSASIGWFGERSLGSTVRTSYWRDKAIDVFVDDWVALICAFPKIIPPEARAKVIRSHSGNTYLFDATLLLKLKQNGQFNLAALRKPHFMDAMHLARWKILALLMLPVGSIAAIRSIKNALNKH